MAIVKLEENRANMLGFVADAQAKVRYEKYVQAWRRVISRLEQLAMPRDPDNVRGKRRRKPPIEASYSVRLYSRVFETFLYWLRATKGEKEPRDIARLDASEWIEWLSKPIPPDIRDVQIAEISDFASQVWTSLKNQSRSSGDANVVDVWRGLVPANKLPGAQPSPESLREVEAMLLRLMFEFKAVHRSPTSREIRAAGHGIRHRLPIEQYRYSPIARQPIGPSSIKMYLSIMGIFWSEMMKGENYPGGEAPIEYNIWVDFSKSWSRAAKEMTHRKVLGRRFDDAIVIAVERVAQVRAGEVVVEGAPTPPGLGSIEAVRDLSLVYALEYLGLRAEELAGALRKDLSDGPGGTILINIFGKGDKLRQLPFDGPVRDTYFSLSALLRGASMGNGAEAQWATELLEDDAPIWPSVPRWGHNCPVTSIGGKEVRNYCNPKEPLDRRGVALILKRLAESARVMDNKTGQIRFLTGKEKEQVHPHNYRRYLATKLAGSGISVSDIQAILGHSNAETTDRYILERPPPINVTAAMIAARTGVVYSKAAEVATAMRHRAQPHITPAEPFFVPVEPRVGKVEGEHPEKEDSSLVYEAMIEAQAEETAAVRPQAQIPTPSQVAASDYVEIARPMGAPGPSWAYSERGVEKYKEYRTKDDKYSRFTRGVLSALPWWRGSVGNWSPNDGAPPVPSYKQLSSSTPDGVEFRTALSELRSEWLRDPEKGFTAASNLVSWANHLFGSVAPELQAKLFKNGGEWIPFTAAQSPIEVDLREHRVYAIVDWFRQYGFEMTQQGENNAPSLVNQAHHKPPAWFMEDDPVSSLPRGEREELKSWILDLQGMSSPKSSKVTEQLSAIAQMISEFDRIKRAESMFKAARGRPITDEQIDWCYQVLWKGRVFQWISDADSWRMWSKDGEKFISANIKKYFGVDVTKDDILRGDTEQVPDVKITVPKDSDQMEQEVAGADEIEQDKEEVEQLESGRRGNLRKKIIRALARAGVDAVETIRKEPAIKGILADPKYLRFGPSGTIEHDESTKQEFFSEYGTDSECVVRRAVRWIWEAKKGGGSLSGKVLGQGLDLAMAVRIPCPTAIEQSLIKRGVTSALEPDDLSSKWADLVAASGEESGLMATKSVEIAAMMEEYSHHASEVLEAQGLKYLGEYSEDEEGRPRRMTRNAAELFPDPIDLLFSIADPTV